MDERAAGAAVAEYVLSRCYTCEHCGVRAPKEAWGAGRIWCPECGRRAMTPAERAQKEKDDAKDR